MVNAEVNPVERFVHVWTGGAIFGDDVRTFDEVGGWEQV